MDPEKYRRRIKFYIISRLAGRRITEEMFPEIYYVIEPYQIEDAWREIRDTMEEIIIQSKGNLSRESIETIIDGVKQLLEKSMETWGAVELKQLNDELYHETLSYLLRRREMMR